MEYDYEYHDPHVHGFPRFAREIAGMIAGLLIWAGHFAAVYVVHTLACARGWAQASILGVGLVPFTIIAVTLAALVASALVLLYAVRDIRRLREEREQEAAAAEQPDHFLAYTTATIAGFSLLSIAWVGLPALFIPPCTISAM